MKAPFIRRARHDVQIAGLQAERDKANTEKRQIGAALSEALKERDALQARLDALTPARGHDDDGLCLRDQKLMEAIGEGARTFHVAKNMGWDTPMTRRALYRLEKAGLIQRDARHSAVNDVRWLPTPPETNA